MEYTDLYKDKYFYEVVSTSETAVQLAGPFDNIYFAASIDGDSENKYKYIQVIDGKAVQAFTEQEILVTNRKL